MLIDVIAVVGDAINILLGSIRGKRARSEFAGIGCHNDGCTTQPDLNARIA
jgi:hypothetical protein